MVLVLAYGDPLSVERLQARYALQRSDGQRPPIKHSMTNDAKPTHLRFVGTRVAVLTHQVTSIS